MRVAGLDFGTNTCLLLIADVHAGSDGTGVIDRVLRDEVRVVRLGQDVHKTRRLHPEALERAEEAFREFAEAIKENACERVLACATSAARDVTNGSELTDLAARYGIPVQIISGEQEAEFTFRGTVDDLNGPTLIIDVGGGSTEFILGDQNGLQQRESVDVGSVRLTELFVTAHPVPQEELEKMRAYIVEKLSGIKTRFANRGLKTIAVAGTPTTLASMDQGRAFESGRVHGHRLTKAALQTWLQRLSLMSVEERRAIAGMEAKRADVIVAGTMILSLAAEALGAAELEVSVKGLRYGVAKSLASAGPV